MAGTTRRKPPTQGARQRAKGAGGSVSRKQASASTASASTASVASRLPKVTAAKVRAAKRKFERGILARGEASPSGEPLEPGATHEIVGYDGEGKPILKRRRYSVT